MKTIKILTITGLMLLSATIFSQEPEKKKQVESTEIVLANYISSKQIEKLNDNDFELSYVFYSLKEFFEKQMKELKYNPNEFVEKELQEEQLNN